MKKQLVFIDDSGDPGFKTECGSSSHFVIACVIFEDPLVAEEVALVMKKFRRDMKWTEDSEFKFNQTNKNKIKDLLTLVKKYDFKIRAICVDKSKIRSYELRTRKDSFYNYIIKQVLDKTSGLDCADVRLDGHAGRDYKKSAVTYLRKEVNSHNRKIAKIRFVDSKSNLLIQLADLSAGAILRSKQIRKTDRMDYIKILKSRIEDVWDFQ